MVDVTDVLASLLGGGLAGLPSNSGGSPIGLPSLTTGAGGSPIGLPTFGGGESPIGLPSFGGGGGGSPIGLPSLPGFEAAGSAIGLPVANLKAQTLIGRGALFEADKAQKAQAAAQQTSGAKAPVPQTVPAEYQPTVAAAAAKYNVDPTLVSAQIQQESGWQQGRTSSAGAQGIAQFMPGTAAQYGVNVADPHSSIDGAFHYMADLLKQYNGDQTLALVAYNGGAPAVAAWKAGTPFAESRAYVTAVTANQQAYRAQPAAGAAPTPGGPIQGVSQNTYAAQNGLSRDIAVAICGPTAVDAFARNMGRNPGPAEAFNMARDQGLWDLTSGAHGPDSMVTLLGRMGVPAKTTAPNAQTIADEVQRGHMVIIDTPKHYYQVTGYNPATQQFQFGDAVGANRWATLGQLGQWGYGSARTAIVSTE